MYKCVECSSTLTCTQCISGFYIDSTSSLCFPCQFPCIECSSSSTDCTKCPSTGFYYFDNAGNCKTCSQNLTGCLRCNMAGDECLDCNSTSVYLESNVCHNCPSACTSCLSSTQCLTCASNTTLLDPNALPGVMNCVLCSEFMPHCSTCLTKTVCTSCETVGGPFFLTNPPSNF